METNNNQVSQPALQPGSVVYAAAPRQYQKYGRGRSMKKFCATNDMTTGSSVSWPVKVRLKWGAKSGTDKRSGFIEVNPAGMQSSATPEEPLRVCEIRIRFNNGLVMSRRGSDME